MTSKCLNINQALPRNPKVFDHVKLTLSSGGGRVERAAHLVALAAVGPADVGDVVELKHAVAQVLAESGLSRRRRAVGARSACAARDLLLRLTPRLARLATTIASSPGRSTLGFSNAEQQEDNQGG